MSTTNEDLQEEIKALRQRIEVLEQSVLLLQNKIIYPTMPSTPYQPWVSPSPAPYWQNPIVTYCKV